MANSEATSVYVQAVGGRVEDSISTLAVNAGWGSAEGAFGNVIGRGARVFIKPNWVLHANAGPWGTAPLITDPALTMAVADAALALTDRVSVGDAPLQSCNFEALMAGTGLADMFEAPSRRRAGLQGPYDLRLTKAVEKIGVLTQSTVQRDPEAYAWFDLGGESLLEPVTSKDPRFRVTRYDPTKLAATHSPSKHQYLVARQILESEVVINLPKLKMHKKAGVTAALKNLIGINGHKEFLPHHRVGAPTQGGDCYPRRSRLKSMQERLLDAVNSREGTWARRLLYFGNRSFGAAARGFVDHLGVEGAWSGNDTIWRTCLDLNRILLYGRPDGTMSDSPQRRVLHLVDAMVAGQGDGPLAPQPFPLGLLLASDDAPAIDWVGARLLGYDPAKVPLVREAFGRFKWPLTAAESSAVEVHGLSAEELDALPRPAEVPLGWVDAVDRSRAVSDLKGTWHGRRSIALRDLHDPMTSPR